MSDLPGINPAVAYTCRMLLFQLFRNPSAAGEFADAELARIYARDNDASQEITEVETRLSEEDFTRGPTEDPSPPDIRVAPCCNLPPPSYNVPTTRKTIALECIE